MKNFAFNNKFVAFSKDKSKLMKLVPGLISLGYIPERHYLFDYKENDSPYLVFNFRKRNAIGLNQIGNDRTIINADEPEKIYALAAATEGNEVHPMELVTMTRVGSFHEVGDHCIFLNEISNPKRLVLNLRTHEYFTYTGTAYVKPSMGSIISYFDEVYQKRNSMFFGDGYVTPNDLFDGGIKAGTIYRKTNPSHSWYAPIKEVNLEYFKQNVATIDGKFPSQMLPKEIVETWQKSNEKSFNSAYSFGDIVTDDDGRNLYVYSHQTKHLHYALINIRTGNLTASGSFGPKLRHATQEEIRNPTFHVNISGYNAEYRDGLVHFGCQSFTKDEIVAYHSLFSRDAFSVSITINDTNITKEMLKTILSKL